MSVQAITPEITSWIVVLRAFVYILFYGSIVRAAYDKKLTIPFSILITLGTGVIAFASSFALAPYFVILFGFLHSYLAASVASVLIETIAIFVAGLVGAFVYYFSVLLYFRSDKPIIENYTRIAGIAIAAAFTVGFVVVMLV